MSAIPAGSSIGEKDAIQECSATNIVKRTTRCGSAPYVRVGVTVAAADCPIIVEQTITGDKNSDVVNRAA
jgi:hypothetical protein